MPASIRCRKVPLAPDDLAAQHAIRSSLEAHRRLYTDAFTEEQSRERLERLLARPHETGLRSPSSARAS
jgi:hypothetical protein